MSEMKYSEFINSVINLIPKYLAWTELPGQSIYLCHLLDYAEDQSDLPPEYINKLRATIKRKLKGKITLSTSIGPGTECRINWLKTIAEIYERKGN